MKPTAKTVTKLPTVRYEPGLCPHTRCPTCNAPDPKINGTRRAGVVVVRHHKCRACKTPFRSHEATATR